jgi:hypothetical protein
MNTGPALFFQSKILSDEQTQTHQAQLQFSRQRGQSQIHDCSGRFDRFAHGFNVFPVCTITDPQLNVYASVPSERLS